MEKGDASFSSNLFEETPGSLASTQYQAIVGGYFCNPFIAVLNTGKT
jgi:hypothetical protein